MPGAAVDGDAVSYRWGVAMRALLAVAGGYAISALYTASLALAFPKDRAQAVLGATMLSFTVYCVVAIWAFSARTLARAWLVAGVLAAAPAIHLLFAWSLP
jgi:hypothetical protein